MTTETKFVTLPCNGFWQPVCDKSFQYGDNTGDFRAVLCRWVVDSDWTDALRDPGPDPVITHEGFLTEDKATRFARSLGGPSKVTVREVEPYWYVRNFGRVA
jgi:hypothetical protein